MVLCYIHVVFRHRIPGEPVIELEASAVLLNVEGTSCPETYARDVLVPFARKNVHKYLEICWDSPLTLECCDKIARQAGFPSSYDWLEGIEKRADMIEKVESGILQFLDSNPSSCSLKDLLAFLFLEGYSSAELRSQVFEDLLHGLASWKAAGITVATHSSDSATFQREMFCHTEYGDLSSYFAGFFDTSCGSNTEKSTFEKIAGLLGYKAHDLVYLGRSGLELDWAAQAGLQTVLLARPGIEAVNGAHQSAPTLYDIRISRKANLIAD